MIRKKIFDNRVASEAFRQIKKRVKFFDYENLSKYHSQCFELFITEKNIGL
jgi:hypothetical protein